MNILFLAAWYPVENTPHRGVFVQEHAWALAQAGHTVCVVALDVSNGRGVFHRSIHTFTDHNGVTIHVISLHSRFHKKLAALFPIIRRSCMGHIRTSILRDFKPDIIHSNVLYPAALLGTELSFELKLPHVITEHWSKADRFIESHFFGERGKKAYSNANAVTCVSEFLATRLRKYVGKNTILSVVPNVVRSGEFYFAPKKNNSTLTFIAVATWQSPKRPELFVNALNNIAKKLDRKIELHIFGDGPQLKSIRSLPVDTRFEIICRGFAAKNVIAEQLRKSDFFLHASDIETFSIVVAEALSTGTPVIASNCGALPELVDASNGILCNNTINDWEVGIIKAIQSVFDHQRISEQTSNRFSTEEIGKKFTELYQKLV